MFRNVYAIVVFLVLSSPCAIAYGQDAQIQGQVLDTTGAAIPNAQVRVVDQQTSREGTAKTNENGQYSVTGLAPGSYKLFVEAAGFGTAMSDQVTLVPGQNAVMDFTLKIGAASADIVVTAEKKEERLQDTPVSVTVLNPDQLMEDNENRLQDYFDLVPGFIVTPQQFGRSSLSFHGISPIGGDPTVGIVIDDVPFGVAGSQQSGYVPDIDPGELLRIEALSGPQGTLYGASSMGGLVKFVTRDPDFNTYSGRIETGANGVYNGSDPGYNLRASVNIPINHVLAMRASGFTRQDPGYINDPIQKINGINEIRNFGGHMSALWIPSGDVSVRLSALYQNTKNHGLNEAMVATPGYPESYGFGPLQQNYLPGIGHDDLSIQAYSATVKTKIGAFDLVSLTGYNYTKKSFSVPLWDLTSLVAQYFNNPSVIGVPYFELDREPKVSQEVRASTSIGERVDVTLGGFFTHENVNGYFNSYGQTSTSQLLGPWYYFDQPISTLDESAIFGNVTFRISDRFRIALGARESFFSQKLGEDVSIEFGETTISAPLSDSPKVFTYLVDPSFKITPDVMVYARFASGYRPGSPNVVLPDVPRESAPDTTHSYEGGVKTEFLDRKVSIDGAVYYIDWNDIQLEQFASNGFAYTGNVGGAKSQGVELTVASHPANGMTLGGTFSYDDAVLTKGFPAGSEYYGVPGDRLPLTSSYSGSASIDQRFGLAHVLPNAKGFAGAVVAYVGDRVGNFATTPQRQDLPAYTKLDLHAGFRRESWTITAYANNAADERGVLDGGIGYYYVPARIYITPRTVGMSLVKTF